MSEETTIKKKRVVRSPEMRAQSIDEQIEKLEAQIDQSKKRITELKKKKEAILNPKPRVRKKAGYATVMKLAKAKGLSPEELLKKLDLA